MRILIVEDGFQRGVIAATRALGVAGHEVGIADPVRGHSARSRFSSRWHRIPAPSHPGFIGRMTEIVRQGRYEVVFPGDDEHLWALSPQRDALPALFPYAAHEILERALDKLEMIPVAERNGLLVPPMVDEDDDLSSGPFVVKERIHSLTGGRSRFDVAVATDGAELRRVLQSERPNRSDLFVQRFVEGDLMAVITLSDASGRVVYSAHQRAGHTYPSTAGVSARAEIVRNDHRLDGKIARFLEELGWQGLMELQFILTPEGEHFLVDLNGRFYGSMQLVIAAEANLPNAWAHSATGGELPPLPPARPGTRYQWLEGDVRRVLEDGGRGEVISCLRYAFGATHSIVSWRDPRPAGSFTWRYLTRRTKRRIGFGTDSAAPDESP